LASRCIERNGKRLLAGEEEVVDWDEAKRLLRK
jgi:hypothetical protein